MGGTAHAWVAVGPVAGVVAAVVTPLTIGSGTDEAADHAAYVGQST